MHHISEDIQVKYYSADDAPFINIFTENYHKIIQPRKSLWEHPILCVFLSLFNILMLQRSNQIAFQCRSFFNKFCFAKNQYFQCIHFSPLFGVIRCFFVIEIWHNIAKTQWRDHWGVRIQQVADKKLCQPWENLFLVRKYQQLSDRLNSSHHNVWNLISKMTIDAFLTSVY